MSLIYWWPFTDNTVDKIDGKTFTSTNWSFQSNGKIGNCFAPSWTDSNTISRQIYADNVSIPETFSVAVWVKNNNNFNSPRTYCPIQFSNGDCWLTGASNKGWDFSHNSLRLIFNNGSNVSGNAGNAEVNWGYNPREFLGSWYHIAFTVNKTTRKAELFINGVSKGIKDLPSAVDTYGGTFKLKINWVQGWMLDGSLNDLRIYDHALSVAEVKEISKALVMHYTFDDVLSEPTTNVSTISGWSSYTPYFVISERTETGLKLYRPSSSTNNVLALNNSAVTGKMTAGDIWTFSCYLYVDGKPYKCTQSDMSTYNYSGISYYSNDDGYYTCTFKVGSPDTWVIHASMFGSVGTDVICEIDKIQFEKKDHATPYVNGTRESLLVDESGLSETTVKNNIGLSTDSASGQYSLKCSNTWIKSLSDSSYQKDITLAAWVKPTDYSGDCIIIGGCYLTVNGGGKLSAYCYGKSPAGYHTGTTVLATGVWHHIAVVWDGSYCIGYINGVQEFKVASTGSAANNPNHTKKDIGTENGSTRKFNGLIDDARVYHTALSANDIQELYKTKAYITNKGDIMCSKFIEDKAEAMVTEKSTFECTEVYEEIDSAYERLEYIQTSGSQYIKTGIYSRDNITKLSAHYYQLTYNPGQILFGCYDGATTMYFNYKESGTIEHRSHWMYTDLRTGAEWKENQDVKSTLVINGNNLTLTNNGKTVTGVSSRSKGNNSYEMLLCAYSDRGSAGYAFYCRLYNFQIEVDNVLVRNFIPVKRKSDNVLGLFDSVNKVFYTNAGSGTFGAGPSVTNNNASIYEDGHISGREIIEI